LKAVEKVSTHISKELSKGKSENGDSARNFLKPFEDAIEAYRLGMGFLETDEPEQAVSAFSEALRLHPKYVHAWFARGYAHACRGDLTRAIDDFGEAICFDADYAAAYYNRAAAYRRMGEHEKAAADQRQFEHLQRQQK
jgi:tetratricopeptide (TPR) repeat protein